MMTPYDDCHAKVEINNLKDWQGRQNGHLRSIDHSLDVLATSDAERRGAANMLKWIISVAGVSGLISIAGLIVGLAGG